MAGSANNAPLGHMRRPLSIGGAAGGIGGGSLLNPTYMSGNAGRNMNIWIMINVMYKIYNIIEFPSILHYFHYHDLFLFGYGLTWKSNKMLKCKVY